MRMISRMLILAVLSCGISAGCGKKDKTDNSNIQTPDDQPIGAPKPLGKDGERLKGRRVPLEQ